MSPNLSIWVIEFYTSNTVKVLNLRHTHENLIFSILTNSANNDIYFYVPLIGERAKRARHSQVCSIENRIYIYYYGTCNFVLITRKEGGA